MNLNEENTFLMIKLVLVIFAMSIIQLVVFFLGEKLRFIEQIIIVLLLLILINQNREVLR
jgi:hypothetical protein